VATQAIATYFAEGVLDVYPSKPEFEPVVKKP